MKLSLLMTANAIFALLFAFGFLALPGTMLEAYGAAADEQLIQMARFFGAAMLGYALLTWHARNAEPSKARRAIVLSLSLGFFVGFLVAMQGQLTGVVGNLGWLTVGLYLFFALGYLYFVVARH